MNLLSDEFKYARKKGYIGNNDIYNPREFQLSFVGQFLMKYPTRVSILDKISDAIYIQKPKWEDFTEDNIRLIRNEIMNDDTCLNSKKVAFLQIKSVLNDNKRKLPISSDIYSELLICKSEPTQPIVLTEQEVEMLSNVHIKNAKEQYVHCIFMIACYTGCRHSDAMKIQEENLALGTFTYVSEKTSAEVVLPIHKELHKYVGKYDPDVHCTDKTFNNIIKRLCKRAGINTKVKVFRGGKDEVGEKWEFVASHTARRSFCTNLFLRGVDADSIAPLAGHRDSTVTKRYICAKRPLDPKALAFFND